MRIFGKFVLLLFFLFTVPSICMGEIHSLRILSDNRPVILVQQFGFTDTGFVSVAISSVSVTSTFSPPDFSRLGFLLLPQKFITQALLQLQQDPNFCPINSKFISLLFTFRQLPPRPRFTVHHSYNVTYPNEYLLFFVNCNLGTRVTMDVRAELYNADDATAKNYLSDGLTQLPSLYFIFFFIYLCFVGCWISMCFRNNPSVHRVHLLMGGLLVMKSLKLICAAEGNHYVNVTGSPQGWNVAFYMFQFLEVVLFFTVIVLIGTRWSFSKGKKVLMIVIPLQVLGNVASVVLGETGPFIKELMIWIQVCLWVDVICCCAIIFPIVWSTRETDGKAKRSLTKFRNLVIGYLCFTRIVVFAVKTISSYKHEWVADATRETGTLVFYLVMFNMFRPLQKND